MRSRLLFVATITAAAATTIIGLNEGVARAQGNYRYTPIGGRAQLLGGTGVVYGRDASAGFLNPATAVLVDDTRLSFSANFYTLRFEYAPRWYRAGTVDNSKFKGLTISDATMSDLSFDALPSTLCLFFRSNQVEIPSCFGREDDGKETRDALAEARIGVCFGQTYDDRSSFATEGFNEASNPIVTRQAQTLSQKYTRFSAGPTYAMRVSRAFAIGASIHFSLASTRNLVAASATTYGVPGTAVGSPINSMFYNSARGDSFQLEGLIGGTWRFGKQTVGVSLKSPSIHIFGRGGLNQHAHFDGAGSGTALTTADGSFISRSPMRLALGSGFEGEWGLMEVNATYSHSLGDAYTADISGHQLATTTTSFSDRDIALSLSTPARGVTNFSAGLEVFMSPKISLLSGVSTDISAAQKGLQASLFNYYPHRTNRLATSIGVSSRGAGGELMIGGEVSVGWGERLAVNSYQLPPTVSPTTHTTYQLMFIIAGSTSLRNITRAVQDVTNVVTKPSPLKPSTTPTPQKPMTGADPKDAKDAKDTKDAKDAKP